MITIDQLLESVDLDFEPRWVTKNKNGAVCLWKQKPEQMNTVWYTDGEYGLYSYLKLSEFTNKDWTECIYEITNKLKHCPWSPNGDVKVSDIVNTINTLVDAVNKLQTEQKLNYNSDTTKGLSTLVEESEQIDPYAEQRRWVGKLCWYKRCEGDTWKVGRLEKIQENADAGYPFVFDGLCYEICEPVKPDDLSIYKGD